jgi:ribosomal 50S subunit-associated protein YjgA (DUF615 family)
VAQETVGSASFALATHVQSIGQLMAYAEHKNIGSEVWQDIGWMLTTFGRQLMDLHNLDQDLSEAIDKAKASTQKATKKGGV